MTLEILVVGNLVILGLLCWWMNELTKLIRVTVDLLLELRSAKHAATENDPLNLPAPERLQRMVIADACFEKRWTLGRDAIPDGADGWFIFDETTNTHLAQFERTPVGAWLSAIAGERS